MSTPKTLCDVNPQTAQPLKAEGQVGGCASGPKCTKAAQLVRCDDCDWKGTEDQLGKTLCEIHRLWERIEAGGIVPAGECPECGSLAYLLIAEECAPEVSITHRLDEAHDKLSALLEDDDAESRDIRKAAIDICLALNAHRYAVAGLVDLAQLTRRNVSSMLHMLPANADATERKSLEKWLGDANGALGKAGIW